jgi:hypothetical protein
LARELPLQKGEIFEVSFGLSLNPPAPFTKGGDVRGLAKEEIFGVSFGLSLNPPGPLYKRGRYLGGDI